MSAQIRVRHNPPARQIRVSHPEVPVICLVGHGHVVAGRDAGLEEVPDVVGCCCEWHRLSVRVPLHDVRSVHARPPVLTESIVVIPRVGRSAVVAVTTVTADPIVVLIIGEFQNRAERRGAVQGHTPTFRALARLCCHQNHAIRGTCAIQRGSSRAFQDRNLCNVIWVDDLCGIAEVNRGRTIQTIARAEEAVGDRNAVDHEQGLVVARQRVFTTYGDVR